MFDERPARVRSPPHRWPLLPTLTRPIDEILRRMSVAGRRPGGASSTTTTSVELALLPSLRSCLVNLPASLVALLLNANTVAQNVVVELQYRQAQPTGSDGKPKPATTQSVFVGWTGMQSQSKPTPVIGRDGVRGGSQDRELATVEIDATFARRLGLSAGTKVGTRQQRAGMGYCIG